MKPSCSGEGYKDQAFTFKVPTDFNRLKSKVANFKGCKAVGDCTLQIYAHSVEPRQYAIGVPLVVDGNVENLNTNNAVKPANHADLKDPEVVGIEDPNRRKICLPRSDPSAHWTTSNPQEARLVSDQWNWAYQNSDYSPYAGQQPKYISRNLQAAVVIEMLPGNRGSLGLHALYRDNRKGFKVQRQLLRKARKVKHEYEKTADAIIQFLEKKDEFKNQDFSMKNIHNTEHRTVDQQTEYCFRCSEVGSVEISRENQRTYIPSFLITNPQAKAAVDFLIASEYKGLLDSEGYVQIYYAAMWQLMDEFRKAAQHNISYQGAVMKDTLETKPDARKYRRINEAGVRNKDEGSAAAARLAYKAEKRWGKGWCESDCVPWPALPAPAPAPSTLASALAADCAMNDPNCAVIPGGVKNNCAQTEANCNFVSVSEPKDTHGLDESRDCDAVDYCSDDNCTVDVSEMKCQQLDTVKQLFDYVDVAANYEAQDAGQLSPPNYHGVVPSTAANPFPGLVAASIVIFCATLN